MSIKEKPILFNGETVRAILEGRKTQTRRVIFKDKGCWDKPVYKIIGDELFCFEEEFPEKEMTSMGKIKFKVGDRLWVREKHKVRGLCSGCYEYSCDCGHLEITYAADGKVKQFGDWDAECDFPENENWRPSIFLPRFASRLTLEITGIKVERLQDISLNDVRSEGCEIREFWLYGSNSEQRQSIAASVFRKAWESINGPESWNQNPWVWAVSFKVVK